MRVYLERGEVACVAVLPERLDVARGQGTVLHAKVSAPPPDAKLVVCAGDGTAVLSADVRAGDNLPDLYTLPADTIAVGVKLLDAGTLLDVAPIPPAK